MLSQRERPWRLAKETSILFGSHPPTSPSRHSAGEVKYSEIPDEPQTNSSLNKSYYDRCCRCYYHFSEDIGVGGESWSSLVLASLRLSFPDSPSATGTQPEESHGLNKPPTPSDEAAHMHRNAICATRKNLRSSYQLLHLGKHQFWPSRLLVLISRTEKDENHMSSLTGGM